MKYVVGVVDHPSIKALLELHLKQMQRNSPASGVFALNLDELKQPSIQFWSLWKDELLAGIGALKILSADHVEIKSMRTHPNFLKSGVGTAVLLHLINQAKEQDKKTVSLETGSGPYFEAAISLYKKHGFKSGDAFADYQKSDFNQFFHLSLK